MKLTVFLSLLLITSMAKSQISYPPTSATPSGPAGGNLSGTYPNPTVVKINGTALSGLATGLLKNTTTTGVPSIAVAGTDLIGGVGNLTTVGSVPYVSASGILNQDPADFFWDATNNRLGIGTNVPSYQVHVKGADPQISVDATSANASLIYRQAGTLAWATYVPAGTTELRFYNGTDQAVLQSTTGNMQLAGGYGDGGFRLDVLKSGTAGTMRVYDATATTGSTLAVVRAGIAQSTNDLLKIQNNAGTDLVKVSSTGAATVSSLVVGNTASITGSSNTITLSGALTLAGANNQIVFNNQANSANYWIINAGALYAGSAGTSFTSPLYQSTTNCSSSAGPAVCAAAAAGSVIIPAAGTDVTVNTTAVTANSQIFAIFDQSLGTKLGVTCNSTTANPHIGARVAGTSFTIHANVSPVTNPACFSYFIIN